MAINKVFSWFIKKRIHQIELFKKYPHEVQEEVWRDMVRMSDETIFGQEHGFRKFRSIRDFQKAVPIRTYEQYSPYINRAREGEQNVIWPTRIKWFAKSSGTTTDRSKFIPVSKEALEECHYKGGKDFISMYYGNNPAADLYGGKHMVIGGSSEESKKIWGGYSGDLSAIIMKELPIWVELKRTPTKEIALMRDWDEKLERMALHTMQDDVRMLVGVPSWTLVLLKRILEISGKSTIAEVWPNLELFMHGGVSFKPYRSQYDKIIGKSNMNYLETYNASEGLFGIQDCLTSDDLLLMLDYGIFYEFLPMEELGKKNPRTVLLRDVEIGENYALVISTNAGLFRYLIGDTIKFTSKDPFKVQVTGRTKHFINAFGEELIIENAEAALEEACFKTGAVVKEYTACPIYMDESAKGAHEWLIEFETEPKNLDDFVRILDNKLKEVNTDYEAKRSFDLNLLKPLVRKMPANTFNEWMRQRGKLGGQHKVPRLSNDRKYVNEVLLLQGIAV